MDKSDEKKLSRRRSSAAVLEGSAPIKRGRDRIPVGAGIWLLWVGVGANATLSSLGYHWIIAQSISCIFFFIWGIYNVDLSAVVRRFLFAFVEIFFRDFDVAGLTNVPTEGPVIFACAPHNNQFVDGLCVLKGIPARSDIGFLVAGSSMRRQVVGDLAKAINSIPVERPQDLAVKGEGKVILTSGAAKVSGVGTKFSSQLKRKCIIKVSAGPLKGVQVKIDKVLSDTEATLLKPATFEEKSPVTAVYKVIPHLDHSRVFRSVYRRLRKGGAVGIFPEGGSHDRTELLPLKVGITIMALGAMEENYNGPPVKILPVGINYFKGHQFRSRVFIDIGSPIVPSEAMIKAYREGGEQKRTACNDLLQTIMAGIKAVTLEAPDYDTLQFFRAMRRLYWNLDRRMTAAERFALTQAFAKGYPAVKDKPEVKEIYTRVKEYITMLKDFAISDYRVQLVESTEEGVSIAGLMGQRVLFGLLLYRIIILIIYFLAAIPGSVAAAPYFIVSNLISAQKARAAAAKSSVKIAGRDLLATWKILIAMVLVPSLHCFYTFLLWYLLGETAAIMYFFFMPFVSLLTVLSYEMGMKIWNSLIPLVLSIMNKDDGTKVVAMRRRVREQVLKVIKEFKWDSALMDNEEMKHLFIQSLSSLELYDADDDELDTSLG